MQPTKSQPLKILGIDPGFGRMGFGMIEKLGNNLKLIDYGCVETDTKKPLPNAFALWPGTQTNHQKNQPDLVAVEELFFLKT